MAGTRDELVLTLAGLRSALHDARLETQRAAAQHERMAAWFLEQGDQAAAWMERRTAEVQRRVLGELDTAFQALETSVSAVLDQLDP